MRRVKRWPENWGWKTSAVRRWGSFKPIPNCSPHFNPNSSLCVRISRWPLLWNTRKCQEIWRMPARCPHIDQQTGKCQVENLIREKGLLLTSLFNSYLQIRLAFRFCCAFVSGSRTVTYLLHPGCSVRNSDRQFDGDFCCIKQWFCCCNYAVV